MATCLMWAVIALLLSTSTLVLSIPALGARVEGYVERRLLGVAPDLIEPLERAVVPVDPLSTIVDRLAHIVDDVVGERGRRIERPATEIDARVIGVQSGVAAGGN